MKKNKLMLLGIIVCAAVLSGCSAKKEASEMTEAKKETEIQTTAPTTEAMPESNTSDIQTTQAETQSPDSSDSQKIFLMFPVRTDQIQRFRHIRQKRQEVSNMTVLWDIPVHMIRLFLY